jgi:hypothetical protein
MTIKIQACIMYYFFQVFLLGFQQFQHLVVMQVPFVVVVEVEVDLEVELGFEAALEPVLALA